MRIPWNQPAAEMLAARRQAKLFGSRGAELQHPIGQPLRVEPLAGVRSASDWLGIWIAGVFLVEAAQGGFEAVRIPGFEYLNHCLGLVPQLRYGGKQGYVGERGQPMQ